MILIAEDDMAHFFFFDTLLKRESPGAKLAWVKDGEELIEYLNSHERPDILMLDVRMPRKDGREAIQEIKANPEFKDLRVIAFTTSNDLRDKQFFEQFENTSFFTKPDNINDYRTFIRTLVNHGA
jgi:CheY-like chemotaxis protein